MAHQALKFPPAEVEQRFVVAAFEIDIGDVRQRVIDHGLDVVGKPEPGNG